MTELLFLAAALPPWFEQNARALPWRDNKDPYRVWLSEIMLQQTRVEAVIGYYARFLAALPDIPALANAPEDALLKLWEGLGYYNRARNLQKAARVIMDQYGGQFPQTYEEILALPGVGAYTAGAVASICFDLPTPAVDGNVLRVVTRFLEDDRVVDLEQTKKAVRDLLVPLYVHAAPGVLTQSLMELGACVCVPNGAPKCEICPLNARCGAFLHQSWADYPVRAKKKKRKLVHKTVLVLQCGDRYAIRRRDARGLLANLWEFPNADIAPQTQADDPAAAVSLAEEFGAAPREIIKMLRYTHIFTHVEWHMTAWVLRCAEMPQAFVWATAEELKNVYALPSAFRPFLDGVTQPEDA